MLYGSDSSPVSLRESHKYKIIYLFNRSRSTIYQHPLSLILARSSRYSVQYKPASLGSGQQKTWRGCDFFTTKELTNRSSQKITSQSYIGRR